MNKVLRMRAKPGSYVIPKELLAFRNVELHKVKVYNVGISEWTVVKEPAVIISRGIGSCMAIALYDSKHNVSGFFHAMLPYINEGIDKENITKYVDSGIDFIVEEMKKQGANPFYIEAKMAGGASMFRTYGDGKATVGEKNINSAKMKLKEWGIPVVGKDVGGNKGRTVVFNTLDYRMLIRYVWGEKKII